MSSINRGLVVAIIFSSMAVSGSLVFFGMQLASSKGVSGDKLQTEIFRGIDAYIAKQQAEYAKQQGEDVQAVKKVEGDFADDDAFLGEKDAPVVIVEFSDYQCPFCDSFRLETLPKIKEKYIETGKVKFVYRDLPISKHPLAYPAALFAECGRDQLGDVAYFAIHERIFDTISAGFDYDSMSAFAVGLGADAGKLKKCVDGEKFKDEVYADLDAANSVGIKGTPAFIVNGTIVSGAQPFAVFEQVIDSALEEADK